MDQRLQKILSAGGVCSRRKAEDYLREGRVTVTGVPAALGDKAGRRRGRCACSISPAAL